MPNSNDTKCLNGSSNNDVKLESSSLRHKDFDSNYYLDEESGWSIINSSNSIYNIHNDVYYSSSLSKMFIIDTDGLKLNEMNTNSELNEFSDKRTVFGEIENNFKINIILDRNIHAGTAVIPNPTRDTNLCEDRHITQIQFPNIFFNSKVNMIFSFAGVFDGHAGCNCSKYVQQVLLNNMLAFYCHSLNRLNKNDTSIIDLYRQYSFSGSDKNINSNEIKSLCMGIIQSFEQTNNNFLSIAKKKGFNDGTTALICVIFGPDPVDENLKLVVGNCGDSVLILGYRNKDNTISARKLTKEHRPNDKKERERIERAGGRVEFCNGTWRIIVKKQQRISFEENTKYIGLSTSRSIGDLYLKEPILICTSEPEVTVYNIDIENDLFLILATDGVADFISEEEFASIVGSMLNLTPTEVACELTRVAEKKGSMDDKTATVIFFGWSIQDQWSCLEPNSEST
ncbi:homeobox-containing protein [Cryptosporidium ryanae]|uniref:homeobox-containing protein n=1 Tax=Cryptosporidium ryanae TaxID=515981 RepID=UPI00351A10A7|nr:homeobox-containing protein [Cryptosporidium ryanae]